MSYMREKDVYCRTLRPTPDGKHLEELIPLPPKTPSVPPDRTRNSFDKRSRAKRPYDRPPQKASGRDLNQPRDRQTRIKKANQESDEITASAPSSAIPINSPHATEIRSRLDNVHDWLLDAFKDFPPELCDGQASLALPDTTANQRSPGAPIDGIESSFVQQRDEFQPRSFPNVSNEPSNTTIPRVGVDAQSAIIGQDVDPSVEEALLLNRNANDDQPVLGTQEHQGSIAHHGSGSILQPIRGTNFALAACPGCATQLYIDLTSGVYQPFENGKPYLTGVSPTVGNHQQLEPFGSNVLPHHPSPSQPMGTELSLPFNQAAYPSNTPTHAMSNTSRLERPMLTRLTIPSPGPSEQQNGSSFTSALSSGVTLGAPESSVLFNNDFSSVYNPLYDHHFSKLT